MVGLKNFRGLAAHSTGEVIDVLPDSGHLMGFQVQVGYKPGPAAVQVDRPGVAFLKAAHEIYLTKRGPVSTVADDKGLTGAPQVHLTMRILAGPHPVLFICRQKQGRLLHKFIHGFTHHCIPHQRFIRLQRQFCRSADKMALYNGFVVRGLRLLLQPRG